MMIENCCHANWSCTCIRLVLCAFILFRSGVSLLKCISVRLLRDLSVDSMYRVDIEYDMYVDILTGKC